MKKWSDGFWIYLIKDSDKSLVGTDMTCCRIPGMSIAAATHDPRQNNMFDSKWGKL